MSFVVEVQVNGEASWAGNAMVFPNKGDAERYATDIARRWSEVNQTRIVESELAPNYIWAANQFVPITRPR